MALEANKMEILCEWDGNFRSQVGSEKWSTSEGSLFVTGMSARYICKTTGKFFQVLPVYCREVAEN